jgi:hypothetical protein
MVIAVTAGDKFNTGPSRLEKVMRKTKIAITFKAVLLMAVVAA